MSDITKARYYLRQRNSDMQHLTSFGLMLATAESRYRQLKTSQKLNMQAEHQSEKEMDAALDVAVLRYMKRYARLPADVARIFDPEMTLEDKHSLAVSWLNA